jgi:hypothetical protein
VFLIRCQKRVIYRNGMELGERVKTSEMEINQTRFQLFYYLLFNRKREPYFKLVLARAFALSAALQHKQNTEPGAYIWSGADRRSSPVRPSL